jgi:multiple sugar transport system substrate-binding protein
MGIRDNTFRVAVRSFGPFESAIKKQWQQFSEALTVEMQLEAVPFDLHPLHEALFESGGLMKGEWDVAFVSTDWIAEASESGSLSDLSGFVEAEPPEGYPAAWPDSLLRMQMLDGKILGLPYHDGPECLIYRTDLMAGEAELPKTWEEFRAIARRLNQPNDNLYGTAFAAYPDGHNTVYDFCLQLWSRGGDLFDGDGRMNLCTPQAAAALQFYRSIVNDLSAVHPMCREFDSVRSGLAFAAGEVAMMVNWFGFAAMSETIAESRVKGKVSVGRIPCQGGPHVSLNAYWILGIGSGSRLKEIAWKFLKHCASVPMDKLLTTEGAIGCRKSTWRDPDINAAIPFYKQLETLHEDARELPGMASWAEFSKVIDEMVLRALNTDAPDSQLLVAAQAKVDQLIARMV